MSKGVIAVVVTRSPRPYATTLCHLLGIEYNALFTSADASSVEARLQAIITGAGINADELLYVGDTDADREAADRVGVAFMEPPWLRGPRDDIGGVLDNLSPTSLLNARSHAPAAKGSLLEALQNSAGTGRSLSTRAVEALQDCDVDDSLKSAIAWLLLRSAPAQVARETLRSLAFRKVPRSAFDCVIPRRIEYGLVGVSKCLARESEYFDEGALDQRQQYLQADYFAFLRDQHPVRTIHPHTMTTAHPEVGVYAIHPFHDPRGGELLRVAKNWGGTGKGRSGPEVMLSLLELPSVVLAAQMRSKTPVRVVAVPSSPWSPTQPGQFSERLARRAALLSGRPYLDVLAKSNGRIECLREGNGQAVTLVDDQLTHGGSAADATRALTDGGYKVRAVFTWSASNRHLARGSVRPTCWFSDAGWLLGRGGACTCEQTLPPGVTEIASYLNEVRVTGPLRYTVG